MVAIIAGLGTALPSALSTDFLIHHAQELCCTTPRQEQVLAELYRRTSIESRCSVLASSWPGAVRHSIFTASRQAEDRGPTTGERMRHYTAEAGALASSACRTALAEASIDASMVTHLVTVSCTGFSSPGLDVELMGCLPLGERTARTHIGFMGCHGALNALRVANSIVESDRSARVLLCCVELCSLHFQYGWGTDRVLANSLFADGAGALVLVSESENSESCTWRYRSAASYLVPDSRDAMTWEIGDHGFEMRLSPQVPQLVEEWLPEWLSCWLSQRGLGCEGIGAWAIHPGGPRILDAVERCLCLPQHALDQSRAVLRECGNMSSPTVLFILERIRHAGREGPCVVLAFGPGLTMEAALLDLRS